MTSITIEQIRTSTNARFLTATENLQTFGSIRSVCTDSRAITPGCLFIAIAGENHDGHDHVQKAFDAGAAAAMVHRDISASGPLIRVDDTRKAMGRLANYIRRQMSCKVIAVAGSNGKTGTKNLIHSILRGTLIGSISPKSFNNDIGVPTTIFAADGDADYLVLEIGTNHPGEILNLTKIAEPDIVVITNVGTEHLEFFGDLDGVTRENAQIIEGLNPAGVLIVNGDEPGLIRAVEKYLGQKITFGHQPANDLSPVSITCLHNGVSFQVKERSKNEAPSLPDDARMTTEHHVFFVPLMGRHTAVNALAAIAVARHLGVTIAEILTGLSTATGAEMRLQLQTAGNVRILNDAYNANPHSMQAGLETLRDMQTVGRRIAILGDMLELGNSADRYHRQLGDFAAGCELDQLICIGEKATLLANQAVLAGVPAHCVHQFSTATECAEKIESIVGDGDLVLLKASRGMKLESIAGAISTLAASDGLRRHLASQTHRVVRPIAATIAVD